MCPAGPSLPIKRRGIVMVATLADAKIRLSIPLLASAAASNGDTFDRSASARDWKRIQDSLERLRELEADWDGQGSLPVDPANLARASSWVVEMRHWQD